MIFAFIVVTLIKADAIAQMMSDNLLICGRNSSISIEVIMDYKCKHGMPEKLGCVICKRASRKKKKSNSSFAQFSNSFYASEEWLHLKIKMFERYGYTCMKCLATKEEGALMEIDHIYPRSLYPQRELDFDNLQVLCKSCNIKKSNKEIIDYRK